MLKNTLNKRITTYLQQPHIKKHLALKDDFNVIFLAQGEYNINYVVDDGFKKFVFRVNTGSQLELDHQIDYEYRALKALEISGVTPKAYFVDDGRKFFEQGILVEEFLEGVPLDYSKDLSKAAGIFSKIHGLDLGKVDTSNFIVEEKVLTDRIMEGKRLLKDYLKAPEVSSKLKHFFVDFLEWAEKHKNQEKYFIDNKWHVINNTEVNSHNFIIGDQRSYLIDWEKPVLSDPCQDLTQFLVPTTTLWKANYRLSTDEVDGFFRAYKEGLGDQDNHIKERVHLYTPYMYLRALSWCAYAWLEYQKPDKAIKNMDTFRKIESYLDVDFMRGLLREYM